MDAGASSLQSNKDRMIRPGFKGRYANVLNIGLIDLQPSQSCHRMLLLSHVEAHATRNTAPKTTPLEPDSPCYSSLMVTLLQNQHNSPTYWDNYLSQNP